MDGLILAAEWIEDCKTIAEEGSGFACTPDVNGLFEFTQPVFSIGGIGFTKTMILILFAALVTVALVVVAFRKERLVPTKFGVMMEALVGFVRNDVAIGIIGPDGVRFFPYLLALFLFILVGNLMELAPFINFPVTSRSALPIFLSLVTYVIFVFVGFRRQGMHYLKKTLFPPGIPKFLYVLVTPIEFVSTFLVRPFSLAVRLFANMVAGHMMLSLMLVSFWVFFTTWSPSSLIGIPWLAFGLVIFLFEILVSLLQAYIFTMLSAVYIQSSISTEH